jgi:hypothetical protein
MNIYQICTKPPQFVGGKTEETLTKIAERYNMYQENEQDHLLEIIVTNNSLAETDQWTYRSDEKFKHTDNITIDILSSKSRKFKDIKTYIGNFLVIKKTNPRNLPNILIMCTNHKRVCEDLIELFKAFSGDGIKFHISFDEADANLGVISNFIQKIYHYIEDNTIIGVLFITATPTKDFWKMLSKHKIPELLNMSHTNTDVFEDCLKDYRRFDHHTFIIHNNKTKNPLEYIDDIFQNNLISTSERNIIFAPSHNTKNRKNVGSHDEIVSYFIDKNYCVLLFNADFKGFIYPGNNKVDINTFKIERSIKGELRDVLREWNRLNPQISLAITGNKLLERGITFNTDGFNFTHVILSNYFLSNEGKLVQIAGRANGHKKYVNIFTVICTDDIKNEVISRINKLIQICTLNPQYMNQTDFDSNSKSSIPVQMIFNNVEVQKEVFSMAESVKKRGNKVKLHNLLKKSIENEDINIIDLNNVNKFDINLRKINSVRMYKNGDKKEVRRFKQFNEAFVNLKAISQSGDSDEYSIDLTKDIYEHEDYTQPTNVAWITFRI